MIEMLVMPDGTSRCVYKDELIDVYDAIGPKKVKRASNVEWETVDGQGGWTVRSAHDVDLAIRVQLRDGAYHKVVSRAGEILLFNTREAALENEVEFFWELLPPHAPPKFVPTETIELTRKEFAALLEYSTSIPTGTTIGKRWRCNKAVTRVHDGTHDEFGRVCDDWWMGEYVEETQEPWKMKGYVGIKWRKILIRETP
jgi:hypothetical protein